MRKEKKKNHEVFFQALNYFSKNVVSITRLNVNEHMSVFEIINISN